MLPSNEFAAINLGLSLSCDHPFLRRNQRRIIGERLCQLLSLQQVTVPDRLVIGSVGYRSVAGAKLAATHRQALRGEVDQRLTRHGCYVAQLGSHLRSGTAAKL